MVMTAYPIPFCDVTDYDDFRVRVVQFPHDGEYHYSVIQEKIKNGKVIADQRFHTKNFVYSPYES